MSQNSPKFNIQVSVFPALYLSVLILLRILFPERTDLQAGPGAVWDAFFSINLTLLVVLTASLTGWKIIARLAPGALSLLETMLFSTALGIAIISLVYFLLGILGFYNRTAMSVSLLLLSLWAAPRKQDFNEPVIKNFFQTLRSSWTDIQPWKKILLLCWTLLAGLVSILALAPPIDYDSLMYHLQGPRIFLEAGSIVLIPEIWQANGPLAAEIIYGFGLSYGSTSFAGLLHACFWIMLILVTFAIARRVSTPEAAWLSMAIVLGIPALPIFASWSYNDFFWAAYEMFAVLGVLVWLKEKQNSWLVLSGAMSGLAMGSKYMALGSVFLLVVAVAWNNKKKPFRYWLTAILSYGFTAALFGMPWYIKNLVLAGNPVYPFAFDGPGYDSLRQNLHIGFLHSFGAGQSLIDTLLIPVMVYVKPERFSTSFNEVPSMIFPLALFYPAWRKHKRLDGLALYALAQSLLWLMGSHQTRFLRPVFPIFAIFAAQTLLAIRSTRIKRNLIISLVSSMIVVSIILTGRYLFYYRPFKAVVGLESKDQYLTKVLLNYKATKFINNQIPTDQNIQFLWRGQSYYCLHDNCIPDSTQIDWLWMTASRPDPSVLARELKADNIHYLLHSQADLRWFLKYHDPQGLHLEAERYLLDQFAPQCGELIYSDRDYDVYRITCPSSP
ncbi:MAG: hypothetical protein JXA13_16835 [Anaerolineales bacterium]|nr:hypothetical protein [Anaerolineales bacterium]